MRYLIVQYDEPRLMPSITKTELAYAKDGILDCIVDLENMTYFDGDNSEWKEIPEAKE